MRSLLTLTLTRARPVLHLPALLLTFLAAPAFADAHLQAMGVAFQVETSCTVTAEASEGAQVACSDQTEPIVEQRPLIASATTPGAVLTVVTW